MRGVRVVAFYLCAIALARAGNLTKVAQFADANWNCADVGCKTRVADGALQPNYGCAPFVAHALAAGGFIGNLKPHSNAGFGAYRYKGTTYNLNCCYSKDAAAGCHGSHGLADYLLAYGWTPIKKVHKGTACIVKGSHGDYSHAIIGVSPGTIDAHNTAHMHKPASWYTLQLCLHHNTSALAAEEIDSEGLAMFMSASAGSAAAAPDHVEVFTNETAWKYTDNVEGFQRTLAKLQTISVH